MKPVFKRSDIWAGLGLAGCFAVMLAIAILSMNGCDTRDHVTGPSPDETIAASDQFLAWVMDENGVATGLWGGSERRNKEGR